MTFQDRADLVKADLFRSFFNDTALSYELQERTEGILPRRLDVTVINLTNAVIIHFSCLEYRTYRVFHKDYEFSI